MLKRVFEAMSGEVTRIVGTRLLPVLIMGATASVQCGTPASEASPRATRDVPVIRECLEAPPSGPSSAVNALYKAYPPEGNRAPQNESKDVLLRFFDEKVAELFVRERECRRRTEDLCNITMSVLYAAQDTGVSAFRVCAPREEDGSVEVRFVNLGSPVTLRFETRKTPLGWRISDIRYPDGSTLLEMLSAPFPETK
jgi:hypothetical protein